jgi:hypothetical protein
MADQLEDLVRRDRVDLGWTPPTSRDELRVVDPFA